ncbi:MAG TPA: cytochrome c oxidase assembly factor Coa1 family protein [Terriglobales bacterium]|nr:cytochrome c oxidase assembly factor Coa1 family protein [Terriglobales bacterium]
MGTPPITPAPPLENAPRPNWWSRNWKWFVPVGCLTIVAVFAAFVASVVFLAMGAMKNADVTQAALKKAQANPTLQKRLGTPIEVTNFVSGSINQAGTSGKADLTIPIQGPKGKATMYADATRFAGEWKFNRLEVGFEGDPNRLDLLEQSPPEPPDH